jgi:hypothetical protein
MSMAGYSGKPEAAYQGYKGGNVKYPRWAGLRHGRPFLIQIDIKAKNI